MTALKVSLSTRLVSDSLRNCDRTEGHWLALIGTWRSVLVQHKEKASALFQLFDEDDSGELSKREFRHGVMRLGLNAPRQELNDLFDHFDADGTHCT